MSSGVSCGIKAHQPFWQVVEYKFNRSAFNGYRRTPSDHSLVRCTECGAAWRTKAAYVETLPRDDR